MVIPAAVNAAAGVNGVAVAATASRVKTGATVATVGRVAKAGPKPVPRCGVKPDRKAVQRVALRAGLKAAARAEATVRRATRAGVNARRTPTAARWARLPRPKHRAAHRGLSVSPGRRR